MSDFSASWDLTRGRFLAAISGLTHAQLNWRMQREALTLGEMAVHVAGVETSFITQLLGQKAEGLTARVAAAATDGVVNDRPFPFAADELTPELISSVLADADKLVRPVIENPTDEIRARTLLSALGPVIDGTGAFARLAYHAGYHQGQAHLVKTAPGFPAS